MPVRIRLDLAGDEGDAHVLAAVREAAVTAAARAADRAGRTDALDGVAWSGRAPEVSVRFVGDPVPAAAAAHLEATAHAAVRSAVRRLRPAASVVAPTGRTTTRLRRFDSDGELLDALDVFYGAASRPARVIVIAADGGGTDIMVVVDAGPDGSHGVTWGVPLSRFVLPADGRDAERVPGFGGVRADSLHLVAEATGEAGFRTELVAAMVRIGRAATPNVPEGRLADRAAARAKRFRLTGALYEYRYGGTPVAWFNGPSGVADRAGLPVLVLTEEVTAEPRRTRYGSDCPPLRYDPAAAGNADPDQPFLHELEVSDWAAGEFDDLVDTITGELGLPKPRFLGSFLFAALNLVVRRSEGLGHLTSTETRQDVLRHLVKALEAVNTLLFAYTKAVLARDRAQKLPCPLAGQAEQWATYLHRDYFPLRRTVVASLFVAACQDALLERLEKSAADIANRLATTDWLPATRVLLTSLLADLPELTALLAKLRRAKEIHDSTVRFGPEPAENYHSVDGVEVVRTPVFPDRRVPLRDPFRTSYRIKDARGAWRTLDEVDATVKNLLSTAQLTDPFLEKLAKIQDVVSQLRTAEELDRVAPGAGRLVTDAVDRVLFAVLREIQVLNRDKTREAREDRMVAYGLATFQPSAGDDVHAELSGIHRLADKRLGELFSDDQTRHSLFGDKQIYEEGLQALAGHENAKARFREFFELAGLTLLAVFFPEAAFVFGLFQAAEGIHTAHEHAGLQRSLLGGDEILSRAQVEAELAGAWLQGFLAIAPELPAVVRDAIAGARALARREFTAVTADALRAKLLEIVAHLAELTAKQFAASFLSQLTAGYVLNLALSEVVGEFASAVAAEYQLGSPVPDAGIAERARRRLPPGHPRGRGEVAGDPRRRLPLRPAEPRPGGAGRPAARRGPAARRDRGRADARPRGPVPPGCRGAGLRDRLLPASRGGGTSAGRLPERVVRRRAAPGPVGRAGAGHRGRPLRRPSGSPRRRPVRGPVRRPPVHQQRQPARLGGRRGPRRVLHRSPPRPGGCHAVHQRRLRPVDVGQRLRQRRQPQLRPVHEGPGRQGHGAGLVARRRHEAHHGQPGAPGRSAAARRRARRQAGRRPRPGRHRGGHPGRRHRHRRRGPADARGTPRHFDVTQQRQSSATVDRTTRTCWAGGDFPSGDARGVRP